MQTAIERYPIFAQLVAFLVIIAIAILGGLVANWYTDRAHKKKGAP